MQHLFPLSVAAVAPAQSGPSLIGAGGDCRLRVTRAGVGGATTAPFDRFCFVLGGAPVLKAGGRTRSLPLDSLVFAPAGAHLDLGGDAEALWFEILMSGAADAEDRIAAASAEEPAGPQVRVVELDRGRFQGEGFAHQALIDRASGSNGVKINILEVQPGSGSPDFHIHAFDQIYLILAGEMRVDIGRRRMTAGPMTLVYLPAGLVHRNFNAGPAVERHISLLVPEPAPGAIFDYAVEIHDREAELMTTVPERAAVLTT